MMIKKTGGSASVGNPSDPDKSKPSVMKTKMRLAAPVITVSLSTEKSEPLEDLFDYSLLIYGEVKVGKSTLAAEYPDAGHFFFEPGGKGLRVHAHPCPDWATFKQYIKLLKAGDQFQTLVIDTVDSAYERCFEYVCKKGGFEHPNQQNDFGQSWKAISSEFITCMNELVSTGRGMVFISHAIESEFQERSGTTYKKIIPSMPKQAREYLRAFVDIIAYYGYDGKNRLLTIEGSDSVDAGHRVSEHFIALDGDRVHSIPMGRSPKEGMENLLAAFNNEQKDAHKPEKKYALSEQKPPPPPRRGGR